MTVLADLSTSDDTPIFGQPSVWAPRSLGAFTLERDEDVHDYSWGAPWRAIHGQSVAPYAVSLDDGAIVTLVVPAQKDAVPVGTLMDIERGALATYLMAAPAFETPPGTGDYFAEIRDNLVGVWRGVATLGKSYRIAVDDSSVYPLIDIASGTTIATSQAAGTVLLDLPDALKLARSQAGLPVQDLAAMFGIGRRQFYNLVSGDQTTDDDRVARIARVAEAIGKVSDWVGPNSRRVRTLLLARIEGDSIFDAAVADDENRLANALERAYSAAAQATALPHRVPPSQRATSAEATAIRDYLRATRDDSGAASDR